MGALNPIKTHVLITRSIEGAIGSNIKAAIQRSQLFNWLFTNQWANLYKIFVNEVGYKSQSFNYFLYDIFCIAKSYFIWNDLKNSQSISSYYIGDILMGDLIIDTYLRFKPSPVFQVNDLMVWHIIWQSLRDLKRSNDYFKKNKPIAYFSSYSTYIQHGIPVRVAKKNGVRVCTFGSLNVFGKELVGDDHYHTPDVSSYKLIFEQFEDKEGRLGEAKNMLENRLTGSIDFATAYMKKSAYSNSKSEIKLDVKDKVVIFLHDFYDSPHVYPNLIFNDFWEWIIFTIDSLLQSKIPFVVKPHPNQINFSDQAVFKLIDLYPGLKIIGHEVTNVQLANCGMLSGITVYGTVAHELAYLGIPSIACAKHPHHTFDFCNTASSLEEYGKLLSMPGYSSLSREMMQYQALAFCYMHNIFGGDEVANLRKCFSKLFYHSGDGKDFIRGFEKLRNLPAYKNYLTNISNEFGLGNT